MKEFDDLQKLWQSSQSNSSLDFESLMLRVKRSKKRISSGLLWHIVAFAVAVVLVSVVWVYYSFHTWTSYLGLAMVCLCLVLAFLMKWRAYRSIQTISDQLMERPVDFIEKLKAYQQRVHEQNTSSFNLYGLGIGIALGFLLFETYFIVSLPIFVVLVLFAVGWFVASYTIFAKQYLKNEAKQVKEMIDELARISGQL